MLKKTIKYLDFNGNEQEDTYYFNLAKAELVELEVQYKAGFGETLQRLVEANDQKALIAEFKSLILLSYGVKSDDGKRFIKNDELRAEFSQTAAYQEMFMELAFNDGAAADFIKGIVPADMSVEMDKAIASNTNTVVPQLPPPVGSVDL
jgi:hypothetical protein